MNYIYSEIQAFLLNEDGVTSIEYALLGSLIAVVILVAVRGLGGQVCERFSNVASVLGAVDVVGCL